MIHVLGEVKQCSGKMQLEEMRSTSREQVRCPVIISVVVKVK